MSDERDEVDEVDEDDVDPDDENDESDLEDEEDIDIDAGVVTAKVLALAQKYLAEAEYAKWLGKREELCYLEDQLSHDFNLDGLYSFHDEVTAESADNLLHAMSVWHRHDPNKPWTIHLNSVGGEIYAGLGIVDEIISHSLRGGGTHKITVKTRGLAASMGGIILQAGDHRWIGRNSQLMIHRGSAHDIGGTAEYITDLAEWFSRWTEAMIGYFLDRTDTITREEFLAKIDRRDWWLSAKEALEYGFVDKIG